MSCKAPHGQERRRRASVSCNPRDGLAARASGFYAMLVLISGVDAQWPPLAAARIRRGGAPREGAQPGLCALPVPDGPQRGTRGRSIRGAGRDTRQWGAGGVQGGPFARGAQ